ncbi:MAG TPA: SUF system NifU family Fe-S cluster assembly protein [Dehalococcoidia bacterium]|nr:SUF system NifU family Fe-S cluster assembly protein [Dehalococcoidia bacterium]
MLPGEEELDELYREVILEHYRSPRHKGELPEPTVTLERNNPVCGDVIRLHLLLDGERVKEASFTGQGCSISQASASMLMEAIQGASFQEIDALYTAFKALMYGAERPEAELGDLEALEGVKKFPVRVKCATLAWNILQEALEGHGGEKG